MEELKPEDDLVVDSRDRRPMGNRNRKKRAESSLPKMSLPKISFPKVSLPDVALNKQHMMMGGGVIALIILVIGISMALKPAGVSSSSNAAPVNSGSKDISLSDASSLVSPSQNSGENTAPQQLQAPPISTTPTEGKGMPAPAGAQQRIELPGTMVDALSQQQNQVNGVAQSMTQGSTALPVTPATVSSALLKGSVLGGNAKPVASVKPTVPHQEKMSGQNKPVADVQRPAHVAPVKNSVVAEKRPARQEATESGLITKAPAGHFTLQLSGASREGSLKAFAQQNKLSRYQIYETKRDGKPWYVLVSGSYATSAEAKQAISSLPADVQQLKPWVKPIRQVQQDLAR